eukprot:CAMPEP_0172538544 /NCGR_PEP_ID=MMETSP1067-20121228/9915_1 /TAXON_ID=265564 ORGANISM="Thalassiosira punctigera, Strain Tpunct2005C2" /NCGR_SAMPLE_ID=MMETSP1067 /ASSEMBLY_ACC=CAM_ASM_000444 /LENGTH=319 /DNA_ID=CAMNT_0013324061 /DNA_START=116 /DNA_END=1075 /DNA_ORIENTATION=-
MRLLWFPPLTSVTLLWGALLFFSGDTITITPAVAFAPSISRCASARTSPLAQTIFLSKKFHGRRANGTRLSLPPRDGSALFERNDEDEPTTETSNNNNNRSTTLETSNDGSIFQRFLSPRIDDTGLPLTDVLIAQIVAPTFQIYWLLLNHAPNPTWLQPISSYFGEAPELAPRGSLLAPTLIHGAGLAVCWIAGALAARMYERESFTVKGEIGEGNSLSRRRSAAGALDVIGRYDTVLLRLFQAGAFASGMLIVSTQLDLLAEFGGYVQYGESDETDFRLLVATVEVINDIFWEALVIGSWRIIHANFMSTPNNRLKRF